MNNSTNFGVMRAPQHVVFGTGQRGAVARYASGYGQRALIVTDARMAADPQLIAMADQIRTAGLTITVFDGVEPELPTSCIEAGTAVGRRIDADVIIGIGGGSCLDAAKVIAVLLRHGGTPADYYGEGKVPGPLVPLIALPTTAGTGSEVTPVAVLADPEREMKIGIASPFLVPAVAICDPELTLTCPPGLTAVSGADALTHAIEAYTTLRRPASADLAHDHVFVGANVMSDQFALQAISLIAGSLARVVAKGDDLSARADMALGALLAGLAFGAAGTAAAHAIQYPIGALTHTPHGAGVAALMPYVMAWNKLSCEAAMAEVGRAMGCGDAADPAAAAVREVARLFGEIGIPPTLAGLKLERDQIGTVAQGALAAQRLVKNNPRPLDLAGMTEIITAAFDGTLEALLDASQAHNQKVSAE